MRHLTETLSWQRPACGELLILGKSVIRHTQVKQASILVGWIKDMKTKQSVEMDSVTASVAGALARKKGKERRE